MQCNRGKLLQEPNFSIFVGTIMYDCYVNVYHFFIKLYESIYIYIYGSFSCVASSKLDPSPPKKYIQDISKISKVNTKYQAAAGPARPKPSQAQARGRARAGLGPAAARPRAWAELGPGRRALGILYLSWISWIYLGYLCWYIFIPADWGPICIKL